MIRMIIEGEKGKAEHIFWTTMLMATSHSFKIYIAEGAGDGLTATKSALEETHSGDIVILGLDMYTWSTYKTCEKLLRKESVQIRYTLVKLGSRSFETIFVSYTELPKLVKVSHSVLLVVLNEVAAFLHKKRRFHSKLTEFRSIILADTGIRADISTEERFLAWLLAQITQKSFAMRIRKKSQIGNCWLLPCCTAHANTRRGCTYHGMMLKPYRDKMLDLEEKSVLRFNTHTLTEMGL